jgi:hypothetical protein
MLLSQLHITAVNGGIMEQACSARYWRVMVICAAPSKLETLSFFPLTVNMWEPLGKMSTPSGVEYSYFSAFLHFPVKVDNCGGREEFEAAAFLLFSAFHQYIAVIVFPNGTGKAGSGRVIFLAGNQGKGCSYQQQKGS